MLSLRRFLPLPRAPHPSVTSSPLEILAAVKRRPEPQLPPETPAGKMRIHLFSGNFASRKAAYHYCFFAEGNRPEDLTRELPHAYIDTAHVEARFGDHIDRLYEFLEPEKAAAMTTRLAGKNTMVIISEPAFGGFGYALHDTDRLSYLGPLVVDV